MIDYVLKINARNYSVQYKIQSVEISIELGKLVIDYMVIVNSTSSLC